MGFRPQDRSVRWPLSTRTLSARRRGIDAALDEMAELGPPGVLLEWSGPPTAAPSVAQRLVGAGVPVLGFLGAEPSAPGGLDASDDVRAGDVAARLRREAAALLQFGGDALIVPLTAELPGASLFAKSLGSLDGDARRAKVALRDSEVSGLREAAAERLARRLFGLVRDVPGVRFLLLPSAHPAAVFDPVGIEHVLGDLARLSVGVALDIGFCGLRCAQGGPTLESWLGACGASVGMVLLSDHDGQERGDLAIGLGVTRWSDLRAVLPRSRPWVVRPDPTIPLEIQVDGIELLDEALGPAPEGRYRS